MQYLKHEKHGYHIVYSEPDLRAHKKMGWVECDMQEELAKKNQTESVVKKKRGRPSKVKADDTPATD